MEQKIKTPYHCLNCRAVLEPKFCYCPQCSQRNQSSNIRFVDFAKEAFEDIFNLDSRFIRTMRVLITRPGRITRAYIDGQRLTYLPPIRLFLIMSLLLYFIGDKDSDIEPQRDGLLPIIQVAGHEVWSLDLLYKKVEIDSIAFTKAAKMNTMQLDSLVLAKGVNPDPLMRHYIRNLSKLNTPFGLTRIQNAKNDYLIYLFVVSIPVLALCFSLLFRKFKSFFLIHLVHSIHLQSVSFLLYLLGDKIGVLLIPLFFQYFFPPGVLTDGNQLILFFGLSFGIPIGLLFLYYFHRSLRMVYQEGFWQTVLKTMILVSVFLYYEFQFGEFLSKVVLLLI